MESMPRRLLGEYNGPGRPSVNSRVLQLTHQNLNYHPGKMLQQRNENKSKWIVDYRNIKPAGGPKENVQCNLSMPLNGMLFYLDLKDFQSLQNLTNEIKQLGGTIETFLTKDIKCVITNRPKSSYQFLPKDGSSSLDNSLPPTPSSNSTKSYVADSPLESLGFRSSGILKPVKSRTDALLEQALKSSTKGSCDVLQHCRNWNLRVMHVHSFMNWLKNVKARMPKKPVTSRNDIHKGKRSHGKPTGYNHKTKLVRQFLKFEDSEQKYRPQYRQLSSWPILNIKFGHRGSPFSPSPVVNAGAVKSFVQKRSTPVTVASLVLSRSQLVDPTCASDRPTAPCQQLAVLGGSSRTAGVALLGTKDDTKMATSKRPDFRNKSGYCEMCSVRFEEMNKHILGSKHRAYAKKKDHFKDLDKQMELCPSVEEFVESLERAALNRKQDNVENRETMKSIVANKAEPVPKAVSSDIPRRIVMGKAVRPSGVKRPSLDETTRNPMSCITNSSPSKQSRPLAFVEPKTRGSKRSLGGSSSIIATEMENVQHSISLGNKNGGESATATWNSEMLVDTLAFTHGIDSPLPKRRRSAKENDVCAATRSSAVASSPTEAARVLRSTVRRRFPSSNMVAPDAKTMSSPIAPPPTTQESRRNTRSSPGATLENRRGAGVRRPSVSVARRSSRCPRRRILTRAWSGVTVEASVKDSGHVSDDEWVDLVDDKCNGNHLETTVQRSPSRNVQVLFRPDRPTEATLPEQAFLGSLTLPVRDGAGSDDESRGRSLCDFEGESKAGSAIGYSSNRDDCDQDSSKPLDLSFKGSTMTMPPPESNTPVVVNNHDPAHVDPRRLTAGPVDVDIEAVLAEIMSGVVEPLDSIDEYSINMLNNVLASMDQNGLPVGGFKEAVGATAEYHHHQETEEEFPVPPIAAAGSSFGEEDDDDNDWDKSMESYLTKISSQRSSVAHVQAATGNSVQSLDESCSSVVTASSSVAATSPFSTPLLSPLPPSATSSAAAEVVNCAGQAGESESCGDTPSQVSESASSSNSVFVASESSHQDVTLCATFTPPCSQMVGAPPAAMISPAVSWLDDCKSRASDDDLRTGVPKRQNAFIPKHLFRRIHSESSEDSWTVQLVE